MRVETLSIWVLAGRRCNEIDAELKSGKFETAANPSPSDIYSL